MVGALKAYAAANQGVVLSPFILGGAMGPVTQAALIAQAHAESMAGIALTQLVRPGAPVVYGNFLTTLDLKTGAPTFGTPESCLSTYAIGQLCRRLGLPLRCGGHLTAAKLADGQAMQESADSMTAGLMAGTNYVIHAAGWLEGGLTMGYEKFVMDLDRCGMMHRALAGLTIDENNLGKAAFKRSRARRKLFRNRPYPSQLRDSQPRLRACGQHILSSSGARMVACRWSSARTSAGRRCSASYQPPELDPAIDDALLDFMARKKAAVEDRWH